MSIHKSFTKKDLLEIIITYDIPIEDPKSFSKSELGIELSNQLEIFDLQYHFDYPDFYKTIDLQRYLLNQKSNEDLNYKEKGDMIQKAKKIINYCRNGYMLSFTEYFSIDQIYEDGIIVSNHCDIPTCRRAIDEFNKDPKVRNKLEKNISPKMKKILEQKKINKESLQPKMRVENKPVCINFD
jgi:hypothetical protein